MSFRIQSRAVTGLLTGHNTLRRHLCLLRLSNNPFVGGVRTERKPQPTFCVNARLWPHADLRTWAHSFGARRYYEFKLGGHLELQQGCRAPIIRYGAQRVCLI